MNHCNKTLPRLNLCLYWLDVISNKVLEECYVAYKRYKPIEIILFGFVVTSFLLFAGALLINTYYVHYSNTISISGFTIIAGEVPATYIACMLRKRFPKSADTIIAFIMFVIVVQTSLLYGQVPIISPMNMKTLSLEHFNQLLHFNQVHWILWTHSHTHFYQTLLWCYWKLTCCIIATITILLQQSLVCQLPTSTQRYLLYPSGSTSLCIMLTC